MRLRLLLIIFALSLPASGCGTSLAFIMNPQNQYYGFQGVATDAVGVMLPAVEGPATIPVSVIAFIDIPFSIVGDIVTYPYILTSRQLLKVEAERLKDPVYQRKRLRDDDATERENAAWTLGTLASKDPEAHEVLLERLVNDDDVNVRITCAQALGSFPNSPVEVFDALAIAAKHEAPLGSVAVAALDRLARENDQAVDYFCRVLSEKDAEYNDLLQLPKGRNQERIVTRLVASKSKSIRIRAAHMLAKSDFPKARPLLFEALKEKDLELRLLAVEAFPTSEIEFKTLIPTLKEAMKSEEWGVNTRAYRVIRNWGPAAVSLRKDIVESHSAGDWRAPEDFVQALVSMRVKDETHLLALVYGLRDLERSVIYESQLDEIKEGAWGDAWIGRRKRFLESLRKSRPGLIPIWYVEKEEKGLNPAERR